MGLENVPNSNNLNSLEAALNSLQATIESREKTSRSFDTETGFAVTINFFANDMRKIHLSRDGFTSTFSIEDEGPYFIELKDLDDEHVANNSNVVSKFKTEALRLYNQNLLEKFPADEEGQLEMLL